MTTKLKLYEFYQLESELNGVVNQQTGEVIAKGLLGENLKLVVKYHLSALAKEVTAEKTALETLKEGLIKKHGVASEDGNVSIPMYIFEKDEDGKDTDKPKEFNPDYVKFSKDWNELLQEEKDLTHFEFTLDHFSKVETDGVYQAFFKLLKVPE
jgi:hypothetical protein